MRSVNLYIILIIVFAGFAFSVSARQNNSLLDRANSSGKPIFKFGKPEVSLKSMSLLDPERFTMKQQTMMSYSSSGNYGQSLLGMYINTMEYRFNIPLTMRLRVAYQNNMGSLFANQASQGIKPGIETGRLFIPSFDMFYKPWKNTTISFHYRDHTGMNQNGYGNGYGYGFGNSNNRYPFFMR